MTVEFILLYIFVCLVGSILGNILGGLFWDWFDK